CTAQELQEATAPFRHGLRTVAPKLLPPVGLEGQQGLHPRSPQPPQHQEQESQATRAVQVLAEGQKAQTGAPSARRPLIARPMMPPQVGRMLRAQTRLGVDPARPSG
ncbi:MAG: hypothetical protein DDG58_13760, partial [Ardenticatenia bacterium]